MGNSNHDGHNHMDKIKTQQVIRRLSIAEGHIRKVKEMVEGNAYCPDIIHQSQAVQAALKKIDQLVLDNHLNSCVLKNVAQTKVKRQKLADEIIEVFNKQH
jgi:CsoR family transcriptional regulator, copper-sensing transcriptional repressor